MENIYKGDEDCRECSFQEGCVFRGKSIGGFGRPCDIWCPTESEEEIECNPPFCAASGDCPKMRCPFNRR